MKLTLWQQQQQPRIERELARIVDALKSLGVERVILFGSHARGDFNEASDIDLVVILETNQRFLDRIDRVLEQIEPCSLPVEALVYTPAEYEELRRRGAVLIGTVEREGKVLYERPA